MKFSSFLQHGWKWQFYQLRNLATTKKKIDVCVGGTKWCEIESLHLRTIVRTYAVNHACSITAKWQTPAWDLFMRITRVKCRSHKFILHKLHDLHILTTYQVYWNSCMHVLQQDLTATIQLPYTPKNALPSPHLQFIAQSSNFTSLISPSPLV